MSWWVMEQVSVNEAGTATLANIQCDDVSDLPTPDQSATLGYVIVRGSQAKVLATSKNYILGSTGTWVKMEDSIKLDLAGYATEQYVDDGLAEKVDAIVYEAEQTEQDNEISVITNYGAKNLLRNTNSPGTTVIRTVQFTVNNDGSVDIAAGTVTGGNADLSINANVSGLEIGASYVLTGCPTGGSSSGYRLNASGIGADTGNGLEFVYVGNPINVYIRISNGYTLADQITFRPMICRAEITDNSFQPYSPTNRELYEMILALQGG